MVKQKKFGTMGGVYTPSLLTILGVIMYMRLSWVVGNAGTLLTAFLIILLAHTVSVSTGLSLSSVSTDKKIKAGGLYYMLSRSLGFPIGGAIGMTLYVATALSISLYLIGFSESALVVLKDWLGIAEITINHLRIAGTIALIFIFTIAYISTSIAIKTQYIIMSLIALSLVSVFAGTSSGKGFDYTPITSASEVGFSTLFGIFFPAVTGFTAGVAMSGDLRNPKKSIPWGTMLSILTGLIVYTSLTLFIYFKIPMAELRNNTNVLVEFSWIPHFVIAGIWGATLSSALGGILGGPRILQAMSSDSIAPRFFAKGVGKSNEPRRALLFTFILAELGILIGELDVIAGITAMFYMAAYLFINVSCFLEQWASPDFRPTFRIPLFISLLGAIVTFLMMIQLDIVAALASVVVMAFIFLWLTRKQLELGSGDVWQSVWSSIVKMSLKKLNKRTTHQRNWEPNILLFSLGTPMRPHLLELSKAIAGRNGMISNFDLIENKSAKMLFPKNKQGVKKDANDDDSIFYRRQECKYFYDGIENIAQTYGFSGVEPNTVLLGWEPNTQDPARFTQMTNFLHELDYNVLFLDYDKNKGFGKKSRIDIWWQDFSQFNYLTVQLTKFLLAADDWCDAKVRFIYLNDHNASQNTIRTAMERVTYELKDFISIEIVNNELEQNQFYDVVRVISAETDLILMNLPTLTDKNQESFIKETNDLLIELGTTLLMRPASYFQKSDIINIEIEKEYQSLDATSLGADRLRFTALAKSNFAKLQQSISVFDKELQETNAQFVSTIYEPFNKIIRILENHLSDKDSFDDRFYDDIQEVISDVQTNRLNDAKDNLNSAIRNHSAAVNKAVQGLSPILKRIVTREELEQDNEDSLRLQNLKAKLRSKRNEVCVKMRLRKTAKDLQQTYYNRLFTEQLNGVGMLFYELNAVVKSWLNETVIEDADQVALLQNFKLLLVKVLEDNKKQTAKNLGELSRKFSNSLLASLDELIEVPVTFQSEKERLPKYNEQEKDSYAQEWQHNTYRLLNQLKVNFHLIRLKKRLLPDISAIYTKIEAEYLGGLLEIVERLQNLTKDATPQTQELKEIENSLLVWGCEVSKEEVVAELDNKINKYVKLLPKETEVLSLKDLATFNSQQADLQSEWIDIERVAEYLASSNVIHVLDQLLQQHFSAVQSECFKVESAIKLKQFGADSEERKTSKELTKKLAEELVGIVQRLTMAKDFLDKGILQLCSKTNELFTDEMIWSRAKQLNGIIRKEKRRQGIVQYANQLKALPRKVYHKADNWVVKGEDVMLQSSFKQRFKDLENPHAVWRDFVEKVSLSEENKKDIPYYYQQLFMQKHKAPSVPLATRTVELERFNKCCEYFKKGRSGAVLFTGEHYAGFSYLIQNILNTNNFPEVLHFPAPKFIYVDVSRTLERSFHSAIGSAQPIDEYMKTLKKGSVVVIEDIELWWNRTEKGLELFEHISQFIREYSHRYLFILSCNAEFFKFIRKLTSFESCLQDTITMQPLRVKEMKEVIWEHHRASGINLVWRGIEEKDLTPEMNNEMLRKLNSVTQGNIGFAFHLWLSSIEKMEDDKIIINDIQSNELPNVAEPEWAAMLYQFVLHKQIRKRNLLNLYGEDQTAMVEETLESLLRTGIVIEEEANIFEINSFAMMYVLNYLRTKKFIN